MIMLNNKRERKRAREEESRYKSLLRVQIINAKAQIFKFYQFSTKLVNLREMPSVASLPHYTTVLAQTFSQDGEYYAAGTAAGDLAVWKVR